ncbi:MAG TPA: PspC domain-containing protein [Sphingomonas sp.]|nr:PspC domain-containing protein [Sphingomonas sp.]
MIDKDYKPRVSSGGLLLGTCAGISESSGLPALVVRAGLIVALCIWFKLALLAYCGTAIYYRFRR